MNRQFSMSFAFGFTPGQWRRSTEKSDNHSQRIRTVSFPAICPRFLVDCPHSWNTTSFRDQDQEMTVVLHQIFLHTKIRVERLPDILVHYLLNMDMNRILPAIFLVFLLICSVKFCLCRRTATCLILGKFICGVGCP